MNATDTLHIIQKEINHRAYFTRVDVLDQSATLIKARLIISPILFVQIYRNDRFDSTSLVLVYNKKRIYARDRLGDSWHRHTAEAPDLHDTSIQGRKAINIPEFLDEVEVILSAMDLP